MLQSRRFIFILAVGLFVSSILFLEASFTLHVQDRLASDDSNTAGPEFDVGFNLGPSSGSVAVDYRNGTVIVDSVDGDEVYCETMARLSLPSSAHLAYVHS